MKSAAGTRLLRETGSALRLGLNQAVRRNLRGVWVRGDLPASGPVVWMSNHHSWWDFFVAASALKAMGRRSGVLMEAANMGNRELFRGAGVLGTDELRRTTHAFRTHSVLVVFPEGELFPAGPLRPIRPGAEWIANRSGAQLAVVATRVVLRGQQAPEAYLDILGNDTRAHPESAPPPDAGALLREGLAHLDDELQNSDPNVPLPGFVKVVSGVRSWQERLNKHGLLG
ncbi:lysophospholipid acyltransferase family protein [Nakamurella antarctica]|nr:1-acyl-sn-glycerol-3-phosphate acyltransferase [Nakamurella antarctica]